MSIVSNRSLGYPQLSSNLATDQRFPESPPWIVSFTRTAHRIWRNISLMSSNLFYNKGDDKGYRGTARWRDNIGWGLWGSWSRSSVLMELGCTTLPAVDGRTHPEAPWTVYFSDFMEASSCMYDQSLTQSPAPSSSQSMEGGWTFQASNHDLVFLPTSSHLEAMLEPTKCCLIGTKDTPTA